jgi:hypothetical protein
VERIGLVSKDRRLKAELGKWLEDLPGEFELVDIGPPPTGDPALPAVAPILTLVESESEIAATKKPKLIIFDSSYGTPLSTIRDELELKDIPWLAIGTEDHARNPHAPVIHGADDLVLLPLDRSVLLQKVEYLLAGEASVTPSFLYLAKADLPIELAKGVHITHISETGCTISSPRHVAHGVEGTLVSKLFGTSQNERVEVRAIESIPCFDSSIAGVRTEPQFEVKLRFFGLRHKQLLELRKWISAHLPHGLPEIARSNNEPAQKAHIALISPLKEFASLLRSSLENLAHTEIKEFQGFGRFRASLESVKPDQNVPTEPDGPLSTMPWSKEFVGPRPRIEMIPAFPHAITTLSVRMKTEALPLHVEKIYPALSGQETLMGLHFDAWSRDLAPLAAALSDSDREALYEALEWVVANSTASHRPEVQIVATVNASAWSRLLMTLKISILEVPSPARSALVKIQIEEAPEPLAKQPATHARADRATFEAILLDASLLSFDLKTRVQSVNDWLEQFDVRNRFGTRPPLIVFNAKEDKVSAQDFRGTRVRQLVYDFTDRRYQAELFISMSRPELRTSPQLSVAGLKTDLKAYLGRPAFAAAISEVSLMITDRAPMKKGSELLVLSPLWSQAPEGLWARLRSAVPKGDGQFVNEFIFFGASDLVQKEIRRFAREDYIKKKAQGQS